MTSGSLYSFGAVRPRMTRVADMWRQAAPVLWPMSIKPIAATEPWKLCVRAGTGQARVASKLGFAATSHCHVVLSSDSPSGKRMKNSWVCRFCILRSFEMRVPHLAAGGVGNRVLNEIRSVQPHRGFGNSGKISLGGSCRGSKFYGPGRMKTGMHGNGFVGHAGTTLEVKLRRSWMVVSEMLN